MDDDEIPGLANSKSIEPPPVSSPVIQKTEIADEVIPEPFSKSYVSFESAKRVNAA